MMELEATRAAEEFPGFHSMHEGYAVILEELDEMWEAIKSNDREAAFQEAVQVGAMAARFIADFGADETAGDHV
jgi:hypothetical protein